MSSINILGDWGTSSCRLYLCDGDKVLESIEAPGVKFVENVEGAFTVAVTPWIETYGSLDAVLCGMVGSNIGWTDAGYADAPANLTDLIARTQTIATPQGRVSIVSGIMTSVSLCQTPDVMRGEETQAFGWEQTHGGNDYLCFPGTHTKWVKLKDGHIDNFVTSVNGEMFDIIANHSVLVGKPPFPPACIGDEFRHGVEVGASPVPLTQSLMSVRSYQIVGEYDLLQARSYLLGLLIGSDVAKSLSYADNPVIGVIGGSAPASFYAEAIRLLGRDATIFGGQEASLTGLRRIRDHLAA